MINSKFPETSGYYSSVQEAFVFMFFPNKNGKLEIYIELSGSNFEL